MAGLALLVASPILLGWVGIVTEYRAQLLGFGAVYAMAAVSLNLLMGYAGQVSLGHAAFLGIGAYASGWVTWTHELPFLLGLMMAMAMGALAALIVGFPALRIRGLSLAILTMAFGLAMAAMVFRLRAVTGSAAGLPLPRPNINGYILNDNREYLSVLLGLAIAIIWFDRNLLRSRVGRAWNALREDEDVASSFGVDVARYKLLAFVLSGAAMGAAGCAFGHLVGIAQVESFNVQLSLTFVTIVVLGGLGSRTGAVVVAVVFGVLPRLFTGLEGWDLVVGPALVALTIARHPGGLAQQWRERPWQRRPRRSADASRRDDEPLVVSFGVGSGDADVSVEGRDASGPPLLVDDLTVAFGGLVAVDGVSLVAPSGEISGLIGPNGAGKSTVFNAVSGFVPSTSGRVSIAGIDVTDRPTHARAAAGLGRTFQNIGLARSLSVTDNLLLARHRHAAYRFADALVAGHRARTSERQLRDDAHEVITALGFDRYRDTPVGSLSHGQQRIVEIACALATRPAVLLLDEPSAGLSPAATEALAERLLDLGDRLGQTILLIEHHIPLVRATCSQVTVMAEGKVLASGHTDDVLGDRRVVDAYLGGVV